MKKVFLLIMFLFLLIGEAAASKAGEIKTGRRAYNKGDYDAAVNSYENVLKKDPESDLANYNLGTAYYKKGDYEKAVNYLQKSLLSENLKIKKNAYYNLGNALYKSGMQKAESDLDFAIASLGKAL